MSYEDKILDKFADMIMPPGTIIAYQGIEAPEGFIVYDHIKIYEDEFPRLYPVLAANPNFKKGTDGDGRKWVELPEIEDLCIQMTTDTSQVGKTLKAQLPNSTGQTGVYAWDGYTGWGSLIMDDDVNPTRVARTDEASTAVYRSLQSDLSKGNSIFGGTTVQPSALQILPCIRV